MSSWLAKNERLIEDLRVGDRVCTDAGVCTVVRNPKVSQHVTIRLRNRYRLEFEVTYPTGSPFVLELMDDNEKEQFEAIENGLKAEERLNAITKRAEDITAHIPFTHLIFDEAMKSGLPQSVASDMALDYWRTEAFYRPYVVLMDGDDEL